MYANETLPFIVPAKRPVQEEEQEEEGKRDHGKEEERAGGAMGRN